MGEGGTRLGSGKVEDTPIRQMLDPAAARLTLGRVLTAMERLGFGPVFLIDGTLLGHVRERGFVRGDTDIDLGMWAEDHDPAMIAALEGEGFAFVNASGDGRHLPILKFRAGEITIDVSFFKRSGAVATTHHYAGRRPLRATFPRFGLAKALFQGIPVQIPDPPEQYLAAIYGPDWQHPVTAWKFRYAAHNLTAEGPLFWRLTFPLKRAIWRSRHGKPTKAAAARVVFTDGVFDLIHANHLALLEKAKSLGDYLVVGVASDALTASYKREPVIPEAERLALVRALGVVDHAFLLGGPLDRARMREVIETYNVDHVVYAGSSTPDFYAYAEEIGIMHRLPYHDGVSTSAIIERIERRAASSSRKREVMEPYPSDYVKNDAG